MIHHADLVRLSGRPRLDGLTVTWSLPDGRCGSVLPGEYAPLDGGAVYNVAHTGAA